MRLQARRWPLFSLPAVFSNTLPRLECYKLGCKVFVLLRGKRMYRSKPRPVIAHNPRRYREEASLSCNNEKEKKGRREEGEKKKKKKKTEVREEDEDKIIIMMIKMIKMIMMMRDEI